MSTETTKKKIKIDNGTNYAYAYTDKAIDAKMPTDINVDANGFAILEHAGTEITGQKKKVKFAQIDKSASFNQVTIPTASSLKTVDGTGFGLNILSFNLKDCMNESDYNELVGYILQQSAIAKTYNITLPNLTGVDAVKFTVETPLGNMTQIFYRNSKAITQFNWLCNWTDNDNFMEMITITGHTDEDVNVIKYIGIEQVDITDMPTDISKDANGFAILCHDGTEISGQGKTVKLADVRENGAIIGRDQTTSAPQTDELITKAYADKEYGRLNEANTWTSDNHFDGLTTLDNVVVVGGISSDYGDFIALANDFSNELGQNFKRVTGFVSPYQITDITAYEAFGFVNENGLTDLTKASVLTYVSATGKPRWIDLSTGVPTAYDYQLPKKSGTIALTSDLSEAGTSVTIRRW